MPFLQPDINVSMLLAFLKKEIPASIDLKIKQQTLLLLPLPPPLPNLQEMYGGCHG